MLFGSGLNIYVSVVNIHSKWHIREEFLFDLLRNLQVHFISADLLRPWNVINCFIYICISVVTVLMDRYTPGECCLTEETPPVVSTTSPPGRLFLLPDRHAGRPRAVRPLPQCGHQEEFHSLTPASSHFSLSWESQWREVLASRHCPKSE